MKKSEMKKMQKDFLKRSELLSEHDKYIFKELYDAFLTTIKILKDLEKSIEQEGATLEKEYIKNRPVITVNPAVSQFNSTSKNLALLGTRLSDLLEKTKENEVNELESIFGN